MKKSFSYPYSVPLNIVYVSMCFETLESINPKMYQGKLSDYKGQNGRGNEATYLFGYTNPVEFSFVFKGRTSMRVPSLYVNSGFDLAN